MFLMLFVPDILTLFVEPLIPPRFDQFQNVQSYIRSILFAHKYIIYRLIYKFDIFII